MMHVRRWFLNYFLTYCLIAFYDVNLLHRIESNVLHVFTKPRNVANQYVILKVIVVVLWFFVIPL
jgi:hypothetical protein